MSNKKIIKVFVSSTFCDMHRERDLLRSIEGMINLEIENTRYVVQLVDLRYGIDTSKDNDEVEVEKKVLKGCFDVIDECQLFLLILGDRYGTVLDIQENMEMPLAYEEIKGKSVTHLELLYGNKKISADNTLVCIRNVGDLEKLPQRYCEKEEGNQKLEFLKEQIKCSGYKQFEYGAIIENDEYRIDEYYFNKYVQGFLETMIREYVKNMPKIIEPCNDCDQEIQGHIKKERNQELDAIVKNKSRTTQEVLKNVHEQLLWLRIEDLLNKKDYEIIHDNGGTGRIQLEHRKKLLQELPDDINALLVEICKIIAECNGVKDYMNIYTALCIIAYSQEVLKINSGMCTARELGRIIGNIYCESKNDSDIMFVYDEYHEKRLDPPGVYQTTNFLGRLLAVFISGGILQYDNGYKFAEIGFAKYLSRMCEEAHKKQIEDYYIYVWWFLPNRIQNLVSLLFVEKYELFYECLKYVGYAEEVTSKLNTYIYEIVNKKDLTNCFKKYLLWCVENKKPETEVIWTLIKICLPNGEKYKKYKQMWILFCEEVFNAYRSKNHANLICKYVINIIYRWLNDEKKMAPHILGEDEIREIEDLEVALGEMFVGYDMNNWTDIDIYNNAMGTIRTYYDDWEQICDILSILKFDNMGLEFSVLINFLSEYYKGNISKEKYVYLVNNLLKFGYSYKDTLSEGLVLFIMQQSIINPMCISGTYEMYDTSRKIYNILIDMIRREEYIRCHQWIEWVKYINIELLMDVFENIKDRKVKDFINLFYIMSKRKKISEENIKFEQILDVIDRDILKKRNVIKDW